MPNYFDYISDGAERYDEPDFIEESVNDTFNDTIADMDLHCFQESLVVAGVVVGIAGLIALLIFLIKKILDGKGSTPGLKQQNKEMKKAVNDLRRSGVQAINCKPNTTSVPASASAPEGNNGRAVSDADWEYVNNSRAKTNSGATDLNKRGQSSLPVIPTTHEEPKENSADKFGGNVAEPIWKQPIWLLDDNAKFSEFFTTTFEFLTLAISIFEAGKDATKGAKFKSDIDKINQITLKKYKGNQLMKIQVGYTPLDKFDEHTKRMDDFIETLSESQTKLKRLEKVYKNPVNSKNNTPFTDSTKEKKYRANVGKVDENMTTVSNINNSTKNSVNKLRFAVGKLHTYNYQPKTK